MLLKAKTIEHNGLTALELTQVGGKITQIKAPFPPYFYAPRRLNVGYNEGAFKKTYLSTLEPSLLYKISFGSVGDLRASRVDDCIDADIPYDQRVAIDLGFNVASGAPNLSHMDMEMESTNGMFPNAAFDRCTALSYVTQNRAECRLLDDYPEYELFEWYFDRLEQDNIDVPSDYFGKFADMPWMEQRCRALGIKFRMGRDGSAPYCFKRTFQVGKKVGEDRVWDIRGRVHFDVFSEVSQDQSLFGIKNRQLKTVGEWFGMHPIRVDRARLATLSKEELHDYCLSDSKTGFRLAQIYIRNLIPLTERLQIAFNMCVNRSPSHISNYTYARAFSELDIVADKKNSERYPEFYNHEGAAYQAALVDLFEPCFIEEDLAHIDFNSMYPSNMICFNYSPETLLSTKIIPSIYQRGKEAEYVQFKGDEIRVNDSKLGWIICKVDLKHESVSKRILKGLGVERAQLKGEMKNAKTPEEYEALNSQQWCVKVPMNSIPGYHGMGYAKYGCLPIAAHITGEGRWEISHATQYVRRIGYLPIQRHTDGLYFRGLDCSSEITSYVQSLIPDQFERDVIGVGFDKYSAGIFYETNGYILQDKSQPKPKDIIYHSSGVKGRHLPKVCDKALDLVVRGIFGHDNVIGLLQSVKRLIKTDSSLEDFLMTVKVSHEPNAYDKSNVYGQMIAKARACGINIRWGDEFQYLKTVEYGYMPLGALAHKAYCIDYDYYMERIANVLERPLKVTHNLTEKQITYALKGYSVTPQKQTKQTRLRRTNGTGHIDYKNFMIPEH